ncbi:MAG: hypothetical protein M3445_04820 [Actinomycetota bacterium]|nr:hypothetical protein [Actinomycetota bacterium]
MSVWLLRPLLPSRSARVCCALLTAATLTACSGGDGSTTGSGGDAAESSPGDVLTVGQLGSVLLDVSDLPSGYQIDASPDEDDDDQDFGTSECARKLEELAGTEDESPPTAEVSRTFDTGEDGLSGLEQSVESYEDEDALESSIEEFRRIVGDCGQLTFSANGVPATLTVEEAAVPEHGDDTLGFRMKGQISAFPFELVFGVNRLGHNVHTVMVGGLGEADMAALTQAMDTGFERLEKAHEVDPNAPLADPQPAEPEPTSTLRSGGPGAYRGTTESGLTVELDLPATEVTDSLAGRVRAYLDSVGGEFADTQLVQVRVNNTSSEEIFVGGVTVVTIDGQQQDLESMIIVLNETSDLNPDAYSETGVDLNDELSSGQLSSLKPGAKGSQLFGLTTPAEKIKDVYVNVDGEDVQLGLT